MNNNQLVKVDGVQAALRDNFSTIAGLDTSLWSVVSNTITDASVSVTGAKLTFNCGTVPGTLMFRGKFTYTIPFRVQFGGVVLSQRIANQNIYMGVTNAAGDMQAAWLLTSTTATAGKLFTRNGTNTLSSASATIPSTANNTGILEIEAYIDEVLASAKSANSLTGRSASLVAQAVAPDPNDDYFAFIMVENTATVTATTTTLDFITVNEIFEIPVEVTGGRGSCGGANNSVPVILQGSVLQGIDNGSAGSATFGNYISSAGTNATVVVASKAAISTIIYSNKAATWAYLKLSNTTTVIPGTTTPVITIGLPPGYSGAISFAAYMRFTTGLCFWITGGSANNDTTAIAAGDVSVSILR